MVFDYAEEFVEAVPFYYSFGVDSVFVVPEDGRHYPDPAPFSMEFAYLTLGDGVFPHVCCHAWDEQYPFGSVPAAEDFQHEGVRYAAHHLG